MDPKRRTIYISIIVVCVIIIAVILIWFRGGSSGDSTIPPLPPVSDLGTNSNTAVGIGNLDLYSAPKVFPQNETYDLSVLNTTQFKTLIPFQPITVTPQELGREDPFKKF